MSPSPSPSIPTLIATLLLTLNLALAQTYNVEGTFQAAISVTSDTTNNQQPDLTSAAGAVCPANYPNSCSSIGEAAL
jgi:hypothetical protein